MNILVIEDNLTIAENIALFMRAKWYSADHVQDGEKAYERIVDGHYDFLIIDRMIPGINGLELVRLLQSRKINIPFLFLTALGKTIDKIEGLSLGADDYLVKPFDLDELSLRIMNIMNRRGSAHIEIIQNKEVSHVTALGSVTVDTRAKWVKKNGFMVELSPKEYALLELLVLNRGTVLDRDTIYERIWGEYDAFGETLDTINVHIAHLRRKLTPDIIRTVKLIWYVID